MQHLRDKMSHTNAHRHHFDDLFKHLRSLSHALIRKAEGALLSAIRIRVEQSIESGTLRRSSSPTQASSPAAAGKNALIRSPSALAEEFILLDSALAAMHSAASMELGDRVKRTLAMPDLKPWRIAGSTVTAELQQQLTDYIRSCHDPSSAATLAAWIGRESGQWDPQGRSKGKPLDIARTLQQFFFEKQAEFKITFTKLATSIMQQLRDAVQNSLGESDLTKRVLNALVTWIADKRKTGISNAELTNFSRWTDKVLRKSSIWKRIRERLESKLGLVQIELENACRGHLAGLVKELPACLQKAVFMSGKQVEKRRGRMSKKAAA